MFDARFLSFASISALLVISPGATMAVVFDTALSSGRLAALWTVVGVNIGNACLALASALGMSLVFRQWPGMLPVITGGGALYLAYLGARALRQTFDARTAGRREGGVLDASAGVRVRRTGARPGVGGAVSRGILTNLLNPSVVLFYMTFLPQFIGPQDPFLRRFLALAATHVSMCATWLACCALALGLLSERMARPAVRRALGGLTGLVLIGLGVRLLVR
jgi:threonine/homoserine/homoserine lactone efflux protein